MKNETKGIVYILKNDSFKSGIYKIGICKLGRIEDRIKELSSYTAVPTCFEPVFVCEVDNYINVEKSIHNIIDKYCINKEFFNINPQKVIDNLKLMKGFKIITDQMDKLIEEKAEPESTSKNCIIVQSKSQIPDGYETTEKMKGDLTLPKYFGIRLAGTHARTKTPYYKLKDYFYFKKTLFDQQIRNEKIGKDKQPELKL